MLQDKEGFLWVGTEGGLYRYDGQRFHLVLSAEGKPMGEPRSIHQDARGSLWVGTLTGLYRKEPQGFVPVMQGVPPGSIEGIVDGPGGDLWVSSSQGPFVLQNGTFSLLGGWEGGSCTAIYSDVKRSVVWLAGLKSSKGEVESQIYRWEKGGATPVPVPALNGERVWVLRQDSRDRLWARTSSRLWMLPEGEKAFKARFAHLPPSTYPSLHSGSEGSLWIGTNKGLARIDNEDQLHFYRHEIQPIAYVRVVYTDREGSLWLGSTGLFRRQARGLMQLYGAGEGLPCSFVWNIKRGREGQLCVGTTEGAQFWTADQGWSRIPGLERYTIRTLAQGPDNCWYLAGNEGILFRWDPRHRKLERWIVEAGVPPGRILRLLFDNEGRLWLGTEFSGLVRAKPSGNGFYFEQETSIPSLQRTRVSDLALDAKGRLMVASWVGLVVKDGDVWKLYGSKDGLRDNLTAYLISLANGEVLLAYSSASGVTRLRLEGSDISILQHFDRASGMTSQRVYSMGEDQQGRLWLGTDGGIDVIHATGVDHFGVSDGMPAEDFCAMAVLSESKGGVWFGTPFGIVRFNTLGYLGSPTPPETLFLSGALGKKVFDSSGLKQIESSSTDNNHLNVKLGASSFLNERNLSHQVRLVGFDPEWRDSETWEVRYARLPHGVYGLEARSRHGIGPWGPISHLKVVIRPAWYQALWFRLTMGLFMLGGLLGVGWMVIKFRLAVLQRRNMELEEKVAKRTEDVQNQRHEIENKNKELEAANFRLQEMDTLKKSLTAMLVHDLRSPLSAISMAMELYESKGVLAASQQKMIRSSLNHMLSMLNDMLEVFRGDVAEMHLDLAPVSILEVMHLTRSAFQDRCEKSGLSMVITVPETLPSITADQPKVERVFTNLVGNAIKFTNRGGTITVSARVLEAEGVEDGLRFLTVQVKDTGRGIAPESLPYIFDPYRQVAGKETSLGVGLGLAIVHRIMAAHRGRVSVRSQVGVGTAFMLYFPLSTDAPGSGCLSGASTCEAGSGPSAPLAEGTASGVGAEPLAEAHEEPKSQGQ